MKKHHSHDISKEVLSMAKGKMTYQPNNLGVNVPTVSALV